MSTRPARPAPIGLAVGAVVALLGIFVAVPLISPPTPGDGAAAPPEGSALAVVASAAEPAHATASEPPPPEEPASADALAELGFGQMGAVESDPTAAAQAVAYFREALSIDPLNAGATFGLGWVAQVRGATAEALRAYFEADARCRLAGPASPVEYWIHHNLAALYRERGLPVLAALEAGYARRLGVDAPGLDVSASLRLRALYDALRTVATLVRVDDERYERLLGALEAWGPGGEAADSALRSLVDEVLASAPSEP